MFKKIAIGISCIITALAAATLAGCGDEINYDELYADKVKVVYELNGGYYGDDTRVPEKVNQYYDYVDGLKIREPGKTVAQVGYEFIDWYTGTIDGDGELHYDEKPWDFDNDTVPREGITLYAKWKAISKYAYQFVYVDEDDKEQVLNKLYVEAGDRFCDAYKDAVIVKKIRGGPAGKTAVGVYYNKEHTEEFDDTVVPEKTYDEKGEESGSTVKLYVEFIAGKYEVVSTKDELQEAMKSKDVEKIYVFNDIDMGGEAFNFYSENRGFSNRTLLSNGKRIFNFTVRYDTNKAYFGANYENNNKVEAIHISLFGALINATVKNISFEDVTVILETTSSLAKKIYVAPLAVSARNSTFENVTVKAAFSFKTLPRGYDESFTFDADSGAYVNGSGSVIFLTGRGVYSNENSEEINCNYSGVSFIGKEAASEN